MARHLHSCHSEGCNAKHKSQAPIQIQNPTPEARSPRPEPYTHSTVPTTQIPQPPHSQSRESTQIAWWRRRWLPGDHEALQRSLQCPDPPTLGMQNVVPHLCPPCIHLMRRARIWRGGREKKAAREREAEGTSFRLGFTCRDHWQDSWGLRPSVPQLTSYISPQYSGCRSSSGWSSGILSRGQITEVEC